jgi:hypothetical protein
MEVGQAIDAVTGLRFNRVDNLGAYSIPSETGLLLIPSDLNSDR